MYYDQINIALKNQQIQAFPKIYAQRVSILHFRYIYASFTYLIFSQTIYSNIANFNFKQPYPDGQKRGKEAINKVCKAFTLSPGLYCTSNEQCTSGLCESKTCIGKKQDEVCGILLIAILDFTAKVQNVQHLKQKVECITDQECEPDSGCDNAKCTEYLSIKVGNASTNTNTAEYTVTYGQVTETVELECECPQIVTDKKICPIYTESNQIQKAINAMKTHIKKYAPYLNTEMKLGFIEKELKVEFYKAFSYYSIYKIPDCALDFTMRSGVKLPPPPVQKCSYSYK